MYYRCTVVTGIEWNDPCQHEGLYSFIRSSLVTDSMDAHNAHTPKKLQQPTMHGIQVTICKLQQPGTNTFNSPCMTTSGSFMGLIEPQAGHARSHQSHLLHQTKLCVASITSCMKSHQTTIKHRDAQPLPVCETVNVCPLSNIPI